MNFLRTISATVAILALAGCASAFRDDSRYVSIDARHGYYVLEVGSPLALKLGYTYPPTSDAGSALHRGYGNDVIAFRFNRAGVLVAPPAYFSQLPPDGSITHRLARVVKGATTRSEIRNLFPGTNWRIKQPDGGLLVYHDVPIYDPLEQDESGGGG